jgi:two-component system, OmpR family, sensor histidine kinase KdpD
MEKVFDLFERGEHESGPHGAGLGLAICRAIVVAHGGRIVAQNLGSGARLEIGLPRLIHPAVPSEVSPEPLSGMPSVEADHG